MLIKKLSFVANRLDSVGFTKEADILDSLIRKMAENQNPDIEEISDEDILDETVPRYTNSPEETLLSMLFSSPTVRKLGKNVEEISESLGIDHLDPNNKEVIELIKRIITPKASIYSEMY